MVDHKAIREALETWKKVPSENPLWFWLRQLLDENERLQKENEQNLDIMNRMSNEMDGIEEPFKYEIEQLQAENERKDGEIKSLKVERMRLERENKGREMTICRIQ